MMTSAILRNGPEHFGTVERQLLDWMDANEYESVTELRGSVSYAASDDPKLPSSVPITDGPCTPGRRPPT